MSIKNWKEFYFFKWGKLSKAKPEDMECYKLCGHIRGAILEDRFNGVFFHVENELNKTPTASYGLLKKLTGKIKGAPDYVFMRDGRSIVIEMKSKVGKQHESQKVFESWCVEVGVPYYLCFGCNEAIEVLKKEGFLIVE